MNIKKELLAMLTAAEYELLKEAEYQGGGAMTVDGDIMEALLREVATYRLFEKGIRSAAKALQE